MRRQTHKQGLAARWRTTPLDVNPFQLPARFVLDVRDDAGRLLTARDKVIIQPKLIIIEREVHGDHGACVARDEHAIADFAGIAIRIDQIAGRDNAFAVSVNLHHDDPDLCIPLHLAFDMCDASARWQSWGKVLGLPLLLPARDGTWQEPFQRLGRLLVDRAYNRRRRFYLKGRRSIVAATREMGIPVPAVQRDGAEIIARA